MPAILIADNDLILVQTIQANLQADGFTVYTAASGAEALQSFQQHQPDLVVIDIDQPILAGLETCRTIRQNSATPIFVMTHSRAGMAHIDGLETGADQYIIKPFTLRELQARIKSIFRRQSLDQAGHQQK